MKASIGQKTARIALLILLAALCVFFVCACGGDPASISNLTLEGEILPGAELNAMAYLMGGEKEVARYLDIQGVLEVIEGQDVATADGTKIRIADTAKADDAFKVAFTIKDLRFEKVFTVAESDVQIVQVVCSSEGEAGESIELSARIYPEGAAKNQPTYYVLSGEATVEGNLLKIDPHADAGEIVVQARLEGVESTKKTIRVTTIQTRLVCWETPSTDTLLPGESVTIYATKYPSNSDFALTYEIEKGEEFVEFDEATNILRVREAAPIPSEIVLLAKSGTEKDRITIRVAYPDVRAISTQGSGSVAPGAERGFSYTVEPTDADIDSVKISVADGNDLIEWSGGTSFRVRADAVQGGEIVFLLESGSVYTTISFTVERRTLTSLSIDTTGNTDYLESGEMLVFSHTTVPAAYDGIVNYIALEGADLVTIDGETVTVKEGADIGRVVVVAESADGVRSNEIEFTVSGRYARRVYSSWSQVSLSAVGEKPCVWMVLPNALNAGVMTVLVPAEVTDLVIEGRYEGSDDTAYKDLYFYFRNCAERRVTLWNFGTIATQGLGGTVMDFGSSGTTTVCLLGQNLVLADSPYLLDNTGEEKDGVWNVGSYSAYESLTLLRRSGKYGYRGGAGGTALSAPVLTIEGTGTLTAVAGSGVNGTSGGNGADAEYGTDLATYISGAGGDGGHGGDSGAAIYATSVRFEGGFVTALPGNAGRGAAGGNPGSIEALAGRDVVAEVGAAGKKGKDGVCYPAVRAGKVTGDRYVSSVGTVANTALSYTGTMADVADRLSRYYGVAVYYGNSLYNPYAKKSKAYRYTMEVQSDGTALMHQAQFLMYTMSVMPKNCWREIAFRSGRTVSIYLCKSIKSGSGGNILGLTSETNNVWFATFATEIRGAYYGGYYNIMLHEFTHVFHYNFTTFARDSFETALQSKNYGLGYKSSYGSKERVYGVEAKYDETNSCFLSSYSRKNVMEDTSETLSITATYLSLEPPLGAGTHIRAKFDVLVDAFGKEYETLAPFAVGKTLFAYPHLFE